MSGISRINISRFRYNINVYALSVLLNRPCLMGNSLCPLNLNRAEGAGVFAPFPRRRVLDVSTQQRTAIHTKIGIDLRHPNEYSRLVFEPTLPVSALLPQATPTSMLSLPQYGQPMPPPALCYSMTRDMSLAGRESSSAFFCSKPALPISANVAFLPSSTPG